MAEMLQSNTALRMLDVGGCDLRVKGVLAISTALAQHNRSLETLGLDDCLLCSPPQDASPRHLARMLASNPILKQLYLSKQGIRDFDLEVSALQRFFFFKIKNISFLDTLIRKL